MQLTAQVCSPVMKNMARVQRDVWCGTQQELHFMNRWRSYELAAAAGEVLLGVILSVMKCFWFLLSGSVTLYEPKVWIM